MKKLLVSLAAALICTATASAQMFNLRVEAGPVFSFSSLAEHGAKVLSAGTKVGYHVVGPGQSGHFMSDYYNDQVLDWVEGKYTPETIGKIEGKTLELVAKK